MFKTCKSCNKNVRTANITGYCTSCFELNVDSIKTNYNKEYKKSKGLYNPNAIRTCTKCNKKLKKSSRSGACAECFHKNINNIKKEYHKKRWDSGHSKISHWRHRGVNITQEVFAEYELADRCGICNAAYKSDKVMDHCHETGEYRGALCRQCNAALGKLGDSIDLVIKRLNDYKTYKKQLP
jgi:hypothetical protein